MDINESPVYVLLNPAINHAHKDLPVTIYESGKLWFSLSKVAYSIMWWIMIMWRIHITSFCFSSYWTCFVCFKDYNFFFNPVMWLSFKTFKSSMSLMGFLSQFSWMQATQSRFVLNPLDLWLCDIILERTFDDFCNVCRLSKLKEYRWIMLHILSHLMEAQQRLNVSLIVHFVFDIILLHVPMELRLITKMLCSGYSSYWHTQCHQNA